MNPVYAELYVHCCYGFRGWKSDAKIIWKELDDQCWYGNND